jgi:hypothetical protein
MEASANQEPDSIEITSHCLLRYYVALSLEAARIDHYCQRADRELNLRTRRIYSAKQWLKILEPYYQKRFAPTNQNDQAHKGGSDD